MLKKSLGLFVFSGLVVSAAVVGCSADVVVTPTDGGTATDAAVDTGKPVTVDAAKDVAPKSDAAVSCLDDTLAIGMPAETTAPKSAQALCTSTQVTAFATACLGTTATAATCTEFTDANKACSDCIQLSADNKAKPTPALFPVNEKTVSANVISCGFLTISKPECAIPTINYTMCYRSVCGDCDANDKAATDACQKEAKEGVCKTLAPTKECDDAYAAGKTQIDAACRGADFNAIFSKVANVLCGTGVAPVTDAGTDSATPADAASGG